MPSDKAVLYDPNRRAATSVRDRVRVKREVFNTLLPEMKARAFEVTGIDDMHALGRVQEAVAKVPEGADWKAARKQIAAELSEQWADTAAAGSIDPAKLAQTAKARAETILKQNVFQAYAASRYAEQQAFKEDFPYLMYSTRGDSHVRPSHAALDGKILPVDDPFWRTHYPPWEFGCRCIAIGMTVEEAEAKGVMTARQKDSFSRQFPDPDQTKYHYDPSELNIPLSEMVEGKTPDQAAYFAGTAVDNRVTMPDGSEQSVWRWTLEIKPGLDGAVDAARRHVADKVVLDGISPADMIGIKAVNKATEAFSATRVSLQLPKFNSIETTSDPEVLSSVHAPRGRDINVKFNADAFGDLDKVFKINVSDRLEAGIVRHNAIPSAAEAGKSIALHEAGHIVFNRSRLADKEAKRLRVFLRAAESGDIKSISEYAGSKPSGSEFFAEAFAMWRNGEYLPDYIAQFIREVLV